MHFLFSFFQVFHKDIAFHWPSLAMANGKERDSTAIGISTERRACQKHDTKRSDWHGTGRLEPVRAHQSNLSTTRSIKTDKLLISTHISFKRAKFVKENLSDLNKVTPRVLVGTPFVEIIRYAREQSIDLIVMGTHGHSALAAMLLGTVAEKVVRKAPCPVLTVRDPRHKFEAP